MNDIQDFYNVIAQATKALVEDLELFPAYDSTQQYDRKNDYIGRANDLVIGYMATNPLLAELAYRYLLDIVLEHEKKTGKRRNKGIIYANLGIVQIAERKLVPGVAHLLTAEDEDKDVNPPGYDILNERLWRQFELRWIYPLLRGLNSTSVNLDFIIDDMFLDGFIKNMGRDDRIFFETTFFDVLHNHAQYGIRPNIYTKSRLYAGLQDLCIISENLLRKKNTGTGRTLPNLLNEALKQAGEKLRINSAYTSAENLAEFLNHLEIILFTPIFTSQYRRLHTLVLVRNFTNHHFDISMSVTSPNGKVLFNELFVPALNHILAAILDLKKIGVI